MKTIDESIGLLVAQNDPATRSNCLNSSSECITTVVKQKEGSEPDTVGSHWSGQPGQDLFFNGWKLLF
jgi:hypothetical protein